MSEEGKAEATTYDKFACFCKSKTDEKTTAIGEGETAVETLTATLGTLNANRDQLNIDINGLNTEISGYNDQLKDAAGAIDTAGSTNRRIARGQCYDKAIYGFTILVLVGGLVFLIYWMAIRK